MTYIYIALGFIIILSFICRDTNFYKLILIFGKKGSGKTTFIVKYSMYYLKKGYTVYTNVLGIPGTYYFEPEFMGDYTFKPNSVVFIDEIGLIWDNRDYKDFRKTLKQWFKLQRHYKIRVIGFDQSFTMDIKLRQLADLLYLIIRLGKISVLRPIHKNIGISKDSDGNGQLVDVYSFGSIFEHKFIFLPRYYGMFDSFEVPPLPEITAFYQDYTDYQILAQDFKKWFLFKFRALFLSLISLVKSKIQNKVEKR